MASVTPTNMYVISLGSATMKVGHFNAGVVYGSDYWDTGLTDIITVWPCYAEAMASSVGALGASWTAASGEVHITAATNTAMRVFVLHGLGQDVWNKPAT